MNRLVIVPDEKFEPLVLDLKTRMVALAKELRSEHLTELVGVEAVHLLRDAALSEKHCEVLVWGRSERAYIAAWTSSVQNTQQTFGEVTADGSRGLLHQVFESNRADSKSAEELNASVWTNLEAKRGRIIGSMVAHPIVLFRRCVAVLTVVRYVEPGVSAHLRYEDAVQAAAASSLLMRLLEDQLIRSSLGLDVR
jgi:hypothetical protein